jgi:Xaa-Pro aminopeptidase
VKLNLPLALVICLAALPLSSCLAQETAAPPPPTTERLDDLATLRANAFDPQRLRARRQALLAALPEGAVVVLATPPALGDTWAYRPDPDFLYLSGVRQTGFSILISAGEDVLFAPAKSPMYELWNGRRLAPGTPEAAASGFGEVVDREQRGARISAALEASGGPLFLQGADLEDLELELEHVAKPRSPSDDLHALRQIKDAHEVDLLQRAIDVTAASLREAMGSIQPGQREFEIQAVIEYGFKRYGAQRPGFASIVGSGPNSCVLHYTANQRATRDGDLVVMDVGAEVWGYTADVTRTVPVSGTFSPRQEEIYQVVLAAQEAGIRAVKPGATMRQVHAAARAVIAEAGYGEFFSHGTSHWLGLDVHDVGAYSRPLEPGMVLTVEPGIYIAAESLGVRIEDDVLVTADGARVLSAGVPRTVDELEALMTRDRAGSRPFTPLPERPPVTAQPGAQPVPPERGTPRHFLPRQD